MNDNSECFGEIILELFVESLNDISPFSPLEAEWSKVPLAPGQKASSGIQQKISLFFSLER